MNPYPTLDIHSATPLADEQYQHGVYPSASQPYSSSMTAVSLGLDHSTSLDTTTSSSSYNSNGGFRHHPYSTSPTGPYTHTRSTRSLRSGTTSASDRSGTSGTEDDDLSSRSSGSGEEMAPASLGFNLSNPLNPFEAAAAATPDPVMKPKTSHSRKTAPDHVKRPPNAFILFRSHCCHPETSEEAPDAPGTPTALQLAELNITDHRHISRIASILWKQLTKSEKAYWERRAAAKKAEHRRMHPEYKYKPVFRPQSEIRRRRMHEVETEAERIACEDVAYALLDRKAAEDRAAGREPVIDDEVAEIAVVERRGVGTTVENPPPSRWMAGTLADTVRATQGQKIPLTPRKPRGSRAKPAPEPVLLPHPLTPLPKSSYGQQLLSPPPSYRDRPHSAPTGDFSLGSLSDCRRSSHMRTQTVEPDLFSFMAQLESSLAEAHQQAQAMQASPSLQHPHTAHFDLRGGELRPHTAHEQAHLDLDLNVPYNPTFFHYLPLDPTPQASGSLTPTPLSFAPTPAEMQGTRPRPSHDSVIASLQNYTLSASSSSSASAPLEMSMADPRDMTLSPTSTTFSYADRGQGRPSFLPPVTSSSNDALPLSMAGMKRRGTLGSTRTAQGGDLMLISPSRGSFGDAGGRKFSLGRWEVRSNLTPEGDGADDAQGGTASVSDDVPMAALDFNTQFLYSVFAHSPRSAGRREFSAPLDEEGEDARPDTAASSDYLTDEDRREPASAGVYWPSSPPTSPLKHSSSTPQFHVGATDFFLRPEPALPSSPRPFEFDRPSSSPHESTVTPAALSFNYAAYDDLASTSGPFHHRPSIDALLTASSHSYLPYAPYLSSASSSSAAEMPDITTSHWASRSPRGSDATIRFLGLGDNEPLRIGALCRTPEEAREALTKAQDGAGSGDEPTEYMYLSRDLLEDHALLNEILGAGIGVTYDWTGTEPIPPQADLLHHHQAPYQHPLSSSF